MTPQEMHDYLLCAKKLMSSSVEQYTGFISRELASNLRNAIALINTILESLIAPASQEPMPHVGQIVLYCQGDEDYPFSYMNSPDPLLRTKWTGTGGTRQHPAIVTQVSEDNTLNLVVFLNNQGPIAKSLVKNVADAIDDESGWKTI